MDAKYMQNVIYIYIINRIVDMGIINIFVFLHFKTDQANIDSLYIQQKSFLKYVL